MAPIECPLGSNPSAPRPWWGLGHARFKSTRRAGSPQPCFPNRVIAYPEALSGNQAPSMVSTVAEGRVASVGPRDPGGFDARRTLAVERFRGPVGAVSRALRESVDGWPMASITVRQSGVIRSLYPPLGVMGGWKPPPEGCMSPDAGRLSGRRVSRWRTSPWGTQWGQMDGLRASLRPTARRMLQAGGTSPRARLPRPLNDPDPLRGVSGRAFERAGSR